MKKALIIINPCAGKKLGLRSLPKIIEKLSNADFICTPYITKAPGDGGTFLQNNHAGFDLIVCAGGDGTLHEICGTVIENDITLPVGYIPTGSTNDFAVSLRLPKSVDKAIENIIDGKPVRFDMGEINGRKFIYVASFGAFTQASYATPQNMKNVLGHFAYVLAGIKDITSLKPVHLTVKTDEKSYAGDYIFGAFSNSMSIGGLLKYKAGRVNLRDGKHEMLLIRNPENLLEFAQIVHCLNTGDYNNKMIEHCQSSRFAIHADAKTDWTVDGEYEKGEEEIVICNLPKAVRLIVPAKMKTK